jgi:hypothetical protein
MANLDDLYVDGAHAATLINFFTPAFYRYYQPAEASLSYGSHSMRLGSDACVLNFTVVPPVPPLPPATPTNLSVSCQLWGPPDDYRWRCTATWSASAGATHYEYWGGSGSTSGTSVIWFMEVGDDVNFTVRACNSGGCSAVASYP